MKQKLCLLLLNREALASQIPAALSGPGCHSENKSSQCQVREVASCPRVSPKEFASNLLSHGLNLKWVCERQGDLALVLLGDF